MTYEERVGLAVQFIAVSIAAFAAWQAKGSAKASEKAVEEMINEREENNWRSERDRLENIRGIVIRMFDEASLIGGGGSREYQALKQALKIALVPPLGEELKKSQDLISGTVGEEKLAGEALAEVDKRISDHEELKAQKSASPESS